MIFDENQAVSDINKCIVGAICDCFLTKSLKFYQKWSKIASTMHYSLKPGGLAPVDFLLEITGMKID